MAPDHGICATIPPVDAVRERLRYLREMLWPLWGVAGWQGKRAVWRMRLERRRLADLDHPDPASAIALRIHRFGGRSFYLRPRSSDLHMLVANLVGNFHLPPPALDPSTVNHIAEFGTNIGAALADLAVRFPNAQILGVEPGESNAELARRNVAIYGDRCQVVQTAVWTHDAELVVEPLRAEYGLVVRPREADDPPEWPVIQARSAESLLDQLGPGATVDYLYIQVEGTERRLFEDEAAWLDRVRCVKVEVDGQYGVDPQDIAGAMGSRGLHARVQPVGWGAFVIGLRR